MMLSDAEDGVTPSSDLLGERAAVFDVPSIWIPTSTPVTQITYGPSTAEVPYDTSRSSDWLEVELRLSTFVLEQPPLPIQSATEARE